MLVGTEERLWQGEFWKAPALQRLGEIAYAISGESYG